MSNDRGFSTIALVIAIPALVALYLGIHHIISTTVIMNNMQKQIDDLHLAATSTGKVCNRGDGIDSTPSCEFSFNGESNTVATQITKSGYIPGIQLKPTYGSAISSQNFSGESIDKYDIRMTFSGSAITLNMDR